MCLGGVLGGVWVVLGVFSRVCLGGVWVCLVECVWVCLGGVLGGVWVCM